MGTVSRARSTAGNLLERDDSRAVLHGAYSEARAGTGRLILVAGEGGVGKTALLRAFCDTVRGSSRVLEGACDPLFSPRPLGPFGDIAMQTGGSLAEVSRRAVVRDSCSTLSATSSRPRRQSSC